MGTIVGYRVNRLAIGAAFLLLGACRDHRPIEPTYALPAPGSAVPSFSFSLRDGGELRSSTLLGDAPTVLFLWSTHCPTSRRALAAYRDIQRVYSERGVRVVLLSDDESKSELSLLPTILADSGIVGQVAMAHGTLRHIFDRSSAAPEAQTARVEFVLPAYLVVNRDARVAGRSWGPETQSIKATLDSILKSRPAA